MAKAQEVDKDDLIDRDHGHKTPHVSRVTKHVHKDFYPKTNSTQCLILQPKLLLNSAWSIFYQFMTGAYILS